MKARINHAVEPRFTVTRSTKTSDYGGRISLSLGIALTAFRFCLNSSLSIRTPLNV